MTTAEKIALKEQFLENCITSLRHVVRHNGAAISAKADITEIAEHATDVDPDRVKAMWTDINTIDKVKNLLYFNRWDRRPDLTTEQLMEYGINDERLVADARSWAVVRITKTGTEILTYGGDYFQRYKPVITTEEVTEEVTKEVVDEATGETSTVTETVTTTVTKVSDTEFTQEGNTELLLSALDDEDAAWMADVFSADITDSLKTYTESGEEFYVLPCNIPGNMEQLISIRIERSAVDGSGKCKNLEYGLTSKSCDTSNEGMVGLPHGIWLIYDNSNLVSAPQALMIPKALADGEETGIHFDRVQIVYNALVSGLARLRLVSDSFGDEYIVSTQDITQDFEGTWKE